MALYTKIYLQNACLPSATSSLGYILSTPASRQLENLLRKFSPRSNYADAFRTKTSQPKISLMAGRILRELCLTNTCPMFVRSFELGWLATLASKKLDNLLQRILVAIDSGLRVAARTCWGILWWIVISTNWEHQLQFDSRHCRVIRLAVQVPSDAPGLRRSLPPSTRY